jgi:sterol desaturase/sphingolipid hydroxylase (fatty acid hydroxylase superfamily)
MFPDAGGPMPLAVMIGAVLLLSGLTFAALMLAYLSPKTAKIRPEKSRSFQSAKLARSAVVNSTLSVSLVFACAYGLYDILFYEAVPAAWIVALEFVAVLFVYDFAYYFVHRFLFHEWKVLRRVHTVHHVAKYPTAIDSLYLHPVETVIGLALLFGTIALVGPISTVAFGAVFLVYSLLNILNHSGLDLDFFPFRTITWLARKHDKHHVGMRSGNYSTITPLPDIVFGTAE